MPSAFSSSTRKAPKDVEKRGSRRSTEAEGLHPTHQVSISDGVIAATKLSRATPGFGNTMSMLRRPCP